LICATAFAFSQQSTARKLREENATLSEELRSAQEKAAQSVQTAPHEAKMPAADFSELLRLRSEVGRLRTLSNQLQTLKQDSGKHGAPANVQAEAPPAALTPVQQEIQRQNGNFERALAQFNSGQLSMGELLQQKKQRFDYLTGVAAVDPGVVKREEVFDRELVLDKTLLQQLQSSGATNTPEALQLWNEVRMIESARRGEDTLAIPPNVAK
jgi:pyruvate/2-oxoglutarate dehydrogenase complex dihydrolipoamide acyltransferase (E2) component